MRGGDEGKLDAAIQQTIDSYAIGYAVELKQAGRNNAFLSGPLNLIRGVTLHVGEGLILFGSRNPRDYNTGAGTCSKVGGRAVVARRRSAEIMRKTPA